MIAELTILGSNSATPTKTRNPSAQLLQLNEESILIDCGEGTQKRLIVNRINYQKISTIFISHLHGDHFLGLMGLANTMSLNGRKKTLRIIAPEGLKKLFTLFQETSKAHQTFDIDFIELTPEIKTTIETKKFLVKAIPVSHRIPCFAFKFLQKPQERSLNITKCNELGIPINEYSLIKNGADITLMDGTVILNNELSYDPPNPISYGYVTDTLFRPDLAQEFHQCHTLYHEATYLHNLLDRAIHTHHSTAIQAAEFAKKASVNQLLIGHFSSRYNSTDGHLDEAKSVFLNTAIATENETFEIS